MKNNSTSGYSTFPLPDGRNLGYAEYGITTGSPLLFFHGSPGSSHLHADMADVANRLQSRLIAIDRPGYGSSSPHANGSLLDWAIDIEALTDAMGLARFGIIGFSGGTPYALACAFRLPERVTKVALAGALAPLDVPDVTKDMSPMALGLYRLAQSNPIELKNTFNAVAPSPAALFGAMSASAGEWDKHLLLERAPEFEAEYQRTLQQGTEGVASDFAAASGSWGFPLEGIKTETHLWSGSLDQNTPPAMTHHLATVLRNSRVFVLPDEGHFALYKHWHAILEKMVSAL